MHRGPSKAFLSRLKDELSDWSRDGLLTPAQARRITDRYDLDSIGRGVSPSGLIAAVSAIGALLLGAGVILLIASNWGLIPRPSKLGLVFLTILAVNHAGYTLAYDRGYPKLGAALLFLGALLFGGGIWLVAQIYNISSRDKNGLLFWALGILPVAWLLGMETILALASGLLSFWAVWDSSYFGRPNYPYLALMGILVLPLCYRRKSPGALFVSIVGIAVWLGVGPFAWCLRQPEIAHLWWSSGDSTLFPLMVLPYFAFGLLLYALGLLHSLSSSAARFGRVFTALGSVVLFAVLYAMSFKWPARALAELLAYPIPPAFWRCLAVLCALYLGAFAAAFTVSRMRATPQGRALDGELLFTLILFAAGGMLSLGLNSSVSTGLLSNAMMLLLAVALIAFGYGRQEPHAVNLGFAFFSLQFFTRYCDWGWNYLPRSAFFIVTGAVLLAGAYSMEKQRKKIIQKIGGAR
jgi:uncharacterized membrane protein